VLYHFEGCSLDLTRGCLRTARGEVGLRPKSFDVLRYLVENAGRLVSKKEFIAVVWRKAVVTDETLAHCISEVRTAISDRNQTIIKTVPRRGYLFTADVTRPGYAEPQQQHSGAEGVFERALADRPSIAVLAFTNFGGDPQQEYLSDGITEDIITELSRFSELLVIARNSTFQYKGKAADVRQVGRELGVRYVLEGSVQRASDRIRISAQLIDTITGAHRWAERYDRKLEDVFTLQVELARTIVAILAAYVNKAEAERTLTKPPATWQAYDYYMRAADTFSSFWSSFNVEQLYETRRLLEHSLFLDPTYARAYGMLSHTYIFAWTQAMDGDFLSPAVLARAYELARKAVQLDPNLPQARANLGRTLTWKRQSDAAIAQFEKAVALNPNFTDTGFAAALIYAGEPARAIEVNKTHMRLDPFCMPLVPGWLGLAYYMLRRYSEAVPPLRESLSRAPNHRAGHLWLAATYAQLGLLGEARAQAAEVLRIWPNYTIECSQTQLSGVFKDAQDSEHLLDGFRRAGLPER
jgi:adenylate cyclase